MLRGAVLTVTPVPGTNQCAEIERMARGRAMSVAMRRHPFVYALFINAFMGLPCPKKIAGSMSAIVGP